MQEHNSNPNRYEQVRVNRISPEEHSQSGTTSQEYLPARRNSGPEFPIQPQPQFGPQAPKPKSLSEPISAKMIMNAVRRHWLALAVIGTILAASAATLVYLFLPLPKLTASTTFYVNPKVPVIHANFGGPDNFEGYKSLQKYLLTSDQVLNTVLARTDIRDLPILADKVDKREWLERQLYVDFKNGPEIMRLTMEGDDGETLSTILNAVAEDYIEYVKTTELRKRSTDLGTLEDTKKELERKLNELNQVQKQLAQDGIFGGPQEISNQKFQLTLQMGSRRDRLSTQESELNKLERNLQNNKAQLNRVSDPKETEIQINYELEILLRSDESYRADVKDRDRLEAEIKGHEAIMKDGAVVKRYAEAKAELESVVKRIQKTMETLRPQVKKKVVDLVKYQLEKEIERLETEKKSAENEKTATETELVKINEKLLKLDQASGAFNVQDLADMKTNTDKLHEINKAIADKSIEKQAEMRVNRTGNKPLINSANEGQRRLKYTALAFTGGYALTALGVIILESRRRRVSHTDDIAFGLGMRIVGTVPEMNKSRQSLINWTKEETQASEERFQAVLTESIDATRTMLLHESQQNGLQVIMITSAVGGEGKTSLTTHLSASLARSGHTVLVIDGDMRRPAAHQVFEVENEYGLSELLRGEVSLDDVIFPTPVSNISMLPAGRWNTQTSQYLVHGQWAAMLKELRNSYDFIIVDSPPVLPVVDASLLGQHVDGVLMSVLRDVSQMSLLYEAQQRMLKLNVKILGVVMNGSNHHQHYASPYYSKYLQPHGTALSKN